MSRVRMKRRYYQGRDRDQKFIGQISDADLERRMVEYFKQRGWD